MCFSSVSTAVGGRWLALLKLVEENSDPIARAFLPAHDHQQESGRKQAAVYQEVNP